MRSKYIAKNQLHDIMDNVPPKTRLIMRVALETGLRIGDVVSLRRGNLVENAVEKVAQKTGKAGRWVISDSLMEILRRDCPRRGYLFPGRKGHVTRQTVWRHIKQACQKLEIDPAGISPHSLRKDYAVRKMRTDGFLAAQEGLQHSNADLTRVYAYADTIMRADTDEPIRWCDLEIIVSYILDRLREA